MTPYDDIVDAWADLTSAILGAWVECAKLWVAPIAPPVPTADRSRVPGTTTVPITPASDVVLHPSAWLDGAVHAVAASLVSLNPSTIAAGQAAVVTVTVMPPAGLPPGTYAGVIMDQAANVLARRVEVTIGP